MPTIIAPEVYALDLDFTMYRSNLAFDDMVRIAVARGLGTDSSLRGARTVAEAAGESFDIIAYLAGRGVPEQELNDLSAVFARNGNAKDYLYPDARMLLTALHETKTPFFMYTKGGYATQIAKLRSCGLINQAYVITDSVLKGSDIDAMRQKDGTYKVDAVVGIRGRRRLLARSIFLVEDKPRSFEGLPRDCAGALVDRAKRFDAVQHLGLPKRVVAVSDLVTLTRRTYENAG